MSLGRVGVSPRRLPYSVSDVGIGGVSLIARFCQKMAEMVGGERLTIVAKGCQRAA